MIQSTFDKSAFETVCVMARVVLAAHGLPQAQHNLFASFVQAVYPELVSALPDLMARKFGPACELLFSVLSIASFLCLLGGNLVGAGKIISHLFFNQQNEIPGIWICSFCVWLYTVTGGLFSVAYSDILQSSLGITGVLVCGIWAINHANTAPPPSIGFPGVDGIHGGYMCERASCRAAAAPRAFR